MKSRRVRGHLRRAEECERFANAAKEPGVRREFRALADRWRELAWEAEIIDRGNPVSASGYSDNLMVQRRGPPRGSTRRARED